MMFKTVTANTPERTWREHGLQRFLVAMRLGAFAGDCQPTESEIHK